MPDHYFSDAETKMTVEEMKAEIERLKQEKNIQPQKRGRKAKPKTESEPKQPVGRPIKSSTPEEQKAQRLQLRKKHEERAKFGATICKLIDDKKEYMSALYLLLRRIDPALPEEPTEQSIDKMKYLMSNLPAGPQDYTG